MHSSGEWSEPKNDINALNIESREFIREKGSLHSLHSPAPPVNLDQDEIVGRVRQALEYGNAPQKALKNYRNGDQDIDSVVEAVKSYYGRGGDDIERWRAPVIAVVEERTTSSAPSAPRDETDDSAGGLGGYLRGIRAEKRAKDGGSS